MARRRGDDLVDTLLDLVLVGGIVFVGYTAYRAVKRCEVPSWMLQSAPDLFRHCQGIAPGTGGGSGGGSGGGQVSLPPGQGGGGGSTGVVPQTGSVWDLSMTPADTLLGSTPFASPGEYVRYRVRWRYAGPEISLRVLAWLEPTVAVLGIPPYQGTGEIVSPAAVDWSAGPCPTSGCPFEWTVWLRPETPGVLYLAHAVVTSDAQGIRQEVVIPGVMTRMW